MNDARKQRRAAPLAEFTAALIFLTRLPIRWRGEWPADLDRRALAWFPIVGALIGAAGGLAYWGLTLLGLTAPLAAVVTVAGLSLLTGALHEDGLADVADGFGGGRDREAKLSIMKDSRVGTYGALALILAAAARIGALATLADPRLVGLALIGAHGFSRGLLPAMKLLLPDARQNGVSANQGRPDKARPFVAALIGFSFATTVLAKLHLPSGLVSLSVMAACVVALVLLGRLARRQIGGVTGDVLGAGQQVAEITFLLGIVAALSP
ncbi:adenosylcobinamide-GDP ribazoletransferase [Niveispirillum irakense]|uniref:adenosylcobinamide-GDP ribazoletransferase n=1 Tax=Niveispirillum irakense TaxID=34011 RepID=UPI000420DD74|nr:adenosylcobinamide-GDP ribazoletransferase [Niveispirillum irakense]